MNLFRLLTILILLPVTVVSGMPLVGCRCSNGEVHLSCPKLRAEQSQKASAATALCGTQRPAVQQSCCGDEQNTGCCGSKSGELPSEGESCCAPGCRCTPVLLTAEIGPKLTKVCLPDAVQLDLANIAAASSIQLRIVPVGVSCVESKPDVPIDIVLLYERFLI